MNEIGNDTDRVQGGQGQSVSKKNSNNKVLARSIQVSSGSAIMNNYPKVKKK